ncbi:MAG: single-stranded DNA-binding protein [Bacteroidota bacterium]
MASSLNRAMLIGFVGADPEIRHTQDGRPIANFRMATSDTWKDKTSGERRDQTEWHRIVCFNENLTKVIEQYVRKGSQIYVEGKLRTRKWQDKDGRDQWSTEIVLENFGGMLQLLDRPNGTSSNRRPDPPPPDDPRLGYGTTSTRSSLNGSPSFDSPNPHAAMRDPLNDEIPF